MFVRLGLLHYAPVFAGTKLTNPILGNREKVKSRKLEGRHVYTNPLLGGDTNLLFVRGEAHFFLFCSFRVVNFVNNF